MCNRGDTVRVQLARPRSNGVDFAGVDSCIAPLVQAINAAGIQTVASCCGHGHRPGIISLEDGRELIVMPDYESSRELDPLWPDINGESLPTDLPPRWLNAPGECEACGHRAQHVVPLNDSGAAPGRLECCNCGAPHGVVLVDAWIPYGWYTKPSDGGSP